MSIQSVDKGIEILKWVIANNETITKALAHFNVHDNYLRKTRQRHGHKDDKNVSEFLSLYSKALGNQVKDIKESEDGMLGKNDIVDKEQVIFTHEKNSGILDGRGNVHVKTLDTLVKQAKIDTSIWNIDKHVVNKWDVTNGLGVTYQNWQVKAWLSKTRSEEEHHHWTKFLGEISKHSPTYTKVARSKKIKKYSFELSLPDLHIGKFSWAPESGEDYDTQTAIDRYNSGIDDLISHVSHIKDEIEEIVLPVGNDLFNVDNFRNETTSGTSQHVDGRWQKMFVKAQKLLLTNIDKLRKIARVKVIMISGNHDFQTVWYLGESLKSWYRTAKDVEVDNSPMQRKYYTYGCNLIGFTHGNEEKHQDLGLIMATERPDLWSKSKYREIHLGHFHKSKQIRFVDIDEHQGFRIKILPSLSATDQWHKSKGYMSYKTAMGILYHKDNGKVAEYSFNVL